MPAVVPVVLRGGHCSRGRDVHPAPVAPRHHPRAAEGRRQLEVTLLPHVSLRHRRGAVRGRDGNAQHRAVPRAGFQRGRRRHVLHDRLAHVPRHGVRLLAHLCVHCPRTAAHEQPLAHLPRVQAECHLVFHRRHVLGRLRRPRRNKPQLFGLGPCSECFHGNNHGFSVCNKHLTLGDLGRLQISFLLVAIQWVYLLPLFYKIVFCHERTLAEFNLRK